MHVYRVLQANCCLETFGNHRTILNLQAKKLGVLKTTPLGSNLNNLDMVDPMVEVDHGVNLYSYIYTYFTYLLTRSTMGSLHTIHYLLYIAIHSHDPMVDLDHGVIT